MLIERDSSQYIGCCDFLTRCGIDPYANASDSKDSSCIVKNDDLKSIYFCRFERLNKSTLCKCFTY